MASKKKHILYLEDDQKFGDKYAGALKQAGFKVTRKVDVDSAWSVVEKKGSQIDLAVVDIEIPTSRKFPAKETGYGERTGLVFAQRLRNRHPEVRLVAFTNSDDVRVKRWFDREGRSHHLMKSATINPEAFTALCQNLLDGRGFLSKIFIVHGHRNHLAMELQSFLKDRMGYHKPVIMRQEPSQGLTLIEKFESHADAADFVFVIATADDLAMAVDAKLNETELRARQNVVFELGYFFGAIGRRSGRVVLLSDGDTFLPSDLHGLGWINVSQGIDAVSEQIRKELEDMGWEKA